MVMSLHVYQDSLYHSVVCTHGLLVTDAHGILPTTCPVLFFSEWFPVNRHFYKVRMNSLMKKKQSKMALHSSIAKGHAIKQSSWTADLQTDLISQAALGGYAALSNPF